MNPVERAADLSNPGRPRGVTELLAPFRVDPHASLEFARAAVLARGEPSEEATRWIAKLEAALTTDALPGRLVLRDGEPVGIAVWQEPVALGITVELLHLGGDAATADRYRWLLAAIEPLAGAIAFVGGPLDGLDPDAEAALMASLAYAPYGRSEMRWREGADLPGAEPAGPLRLRPIEARDQPELATLHARAYRDRLDRYLFWDDPDDEVDARTHVADVLRGRWGEPVAHGSWVAEESSQLIGAVLSVRATNGILIADVMVDPDRQGRGIGRAVLSASLRSMRSKGDRPIFLNVTEGNESALRLYDRLGFVRSLGPTHDWYNTRRVPVGTAVQAPVPSRETGSRGR
jgi:ribosomal protein S18 acetylase RimI-like enzyme